MQVIERIVNQETGEILIDWTPADEQDLTAANKQIDDGAMLIWRGFQNVRAKALWRRDYPNFEAWCEAEHGISKSRGHQFANAAELIDIVTTVGVQLKERAARELLHVTPDRRLSVLLAAKSSFGDAITSGVIKSAAKVDGTMLATGGYVDTGNGDMTAHDAAIIQEEYERHQQQRQHIADAAAKANGVSEDEKFTSNAQVSFVSSGCVTLLHDGLGGLRLGDKVTVVIYRKQVKNGLV